MNVNNLNTTMNKVIDINVTEITNINKIIDMQDININVNGNRNRILIYTEYDYTCD